MGQLRRSIGQIVNSEQTPVTPLPAAELYDAYWGHRLEKKT